MPYGGFEARDVGGVDGVGVEVAVGPHGEVGERFVEVVLLEGEGGAEDGVQEVGGGGFAGGGAAGEGDCEGAGWEGGRVGGGGGEGHLWGVW